jgi:hypothetical protein
MIDSVVTFEREFTGIKFPITRQSKKCKIQIKLNSFLSIEWRTAMYKTCSQPSLDPCSESFSK